MGLILIRKQKEREEKPHRQHIFADNLKGLRGAPDKEPMRIRQWANKTAAQHGARGEAWEQARDSLEQKALHFLETGEDPEGWGFQAIDPKEQHMQQIGQIEETGEVEKPPRPASTSMRDIMAEGKARAETTPSFLQNVGPTGKPLGGTIPATGDVDIPASEETGEPSQVSFLADKVKESPEKYQEEGAPIEEATATQGTPDTNQLIALLQIPQIMEAFKENPQPLLQALGLAPSTPEQAQLPDEEEEEEEEEVGGPDKPPKDWFDEEGNVQLSFDKNPGQQMLKSVKQMMYSQW